MNRQVIRSIIGTPISKRYSNDIQYQPWSIQISVVSVGRPLGGPLSHSTLPPFHPPEPPPNYFLSTSKTISPIEHVSHHDLFPSVSFASRCTGSAYNPVGDLACVSISCFLLCLPRDNDIEIDTETLFSVFVAI